MGYWTKKQKEQGLAVNMKSKETVADVLQYPILAVKDRNISKETCERYGVRTAVSEQDGISPVANYFPFYDQQGKLSGFKKRNLTLDKHDKFHFTTVGKVGVECKLFGQDVAESVQRKRNNVVYAEGEWDVLSSYQALVDNVKGTKYEGLEPFIIGLSCGTANAVEATLHNEQFIKSFDSLTFCFDNDSVTKHEKEKGIKRGVEARNDVANALVGSGLSMFMVDFPENIKDPSDMLQANKSDELAKIIQFGKRQYSAEKIVKASDISLEELLTPRPEGIYTKCFPKLDEKLHGFRKRELVLFTSPSGVGKSTVTSMFASCFIEAGERVGMIYLEETKKETLQRMVASKLKVNYNAFRNNPLGCASKEQIEVAYKEIVEDDMLIMLDHFGSMPVKELMNKVKHMHMVEGCSYIIIDHLSLVISGEVVENERKELDIVMTELAAFCAANDVCIIAVSHINRSGAADWKPPKDKENDPFWVKVTKEQMRGSAALEQLSFVIIGLEPEINPDRSRGRVRLTILKNRPWSYLGVADTFTMDDETWEVLLAEDEVVDGF